MANKYRVLSDKLFIAEYRKLGRSGIAEKYDLDYGGTGRRKGVLERKYKIKIDPPKDLQKYNPQYFAYKQEAFPGRLNMAVENGVVLVAGDAHYWPGIVPLMHKALLAFIKEFRSDKVLRAVVMNGDVHDFPTLSRHPLVNWEKRPSVEDEINFATLRMREIEEASGNCEKLWPIGNHDSWFSRIVESHAPQLAGVKGIALKDHYPAWKPCYDLEINDGFNTVVIKHTQRGGADGPKLNVTHSACHFVTNHTHSAKVYPKTFRKHTCWGVDTGCIADPYGPQFLYSQGNTRDWRAGFAVLTFHQGRLLMPELVLKYDDNHIEFRGEVKKI